MAITPAEIQTEHMSLCLRATAAALRREHAELTARRRPPDRLINPYPVK